MPTRVEGLAHQRVTDVATAESHTAALTSDGELYSWGRDRFGQVRSAVFAHICCWLAIHMGDEADIHCNYLQEESLQPTGFGRLPHEQFEGYRQGITQRINAPILTRALLLVSAVSL